MHYIHKAAGILIQDRKLLVEKSYNKDFFLAPGGKIQGEESVEDALIRELHEEFSIHISKHDISFFATFQALSAGQEGVTVIMHVYYVHHRTGTIQASSEVETIARVNTQNIKTMQLGSIFAHEVIPKLYQQGLID